MNDSPTNEGPPAVSSESVARLHRQTLVEVNVSVYTARRNAAHDRVVDVLQNRIAAMPIEQRFALYSFCEELLVEAVQCTKRSLVQSDAPVLHYLRILRDTVAATKALVNHEITLARESEEFQQVLDEYLVRQFRTATTVFSKSEMSIVGSVAELLKFGRLILEQDTTERLEKFNSDDRRRFGVAEGEFTAYYAKREAEALARAAVGPAV